jgi:hypothetical protein
MRGPRTAGVRGEKRYPNPTPLTNTRGPDLALTPNTSGPSAEFLSRAFHRPGPTRAPEKRARPVATSMERRLYNQVVRSISEEESAICRGPAPPTQGWRQGDRVILRRDGSSGTWFRITRKDSHRTLLGRMKPSLHSLISKREREAPNPPFVRALLFSCFQVAGPGQAGGSDRIRQERRGCRG